MELIDENKCIMNGFVEYASSIMEMISNNPNTLISIGLKKLKSMKLCARKEAYNFKDILFLNFKI
ncbi:MAG TPA: hypothetical protein VIY08_06470 [Candidatus Nitrosocosmicus sp.]